MSYSPYQEALKSLRACKELIEEDRISSVEEKRQAVTLLELCQDIVNEGILNDVERIEFCVICEQRQDEDGRCDCTNEDAGGIE